MNRIIVACFLGCAATLAFAQQAGRVMTVTRSVVVFSNLENKLDAALRGNDEGAISKLLAADFEQRDGNAPDQPLPRAEWLKVSHVTPSISRMAVHEYGNVAVVSFADAAQHAFIVDVWNKTADGYALSVRYSSNSAAAPQTQPENPAK